MIRLILSAVLLISLSVGGTAKTITGRVTHVYDGDTIKLIHKNRPLKIRLDHIDAPEAGQAFSQAAENYMVKRIKGKTVKVVITGKDRYKRQTGIVISGGRNINKDLVQRGYARWFQFYSNDRSYKTLEQQAKQAKRGIWSKKTEAPWEFRNKNRKPISV